MLQPTIASGCLVIPFDCDPRYHYWAGGQAIADTLLELGATADVLRRYDPEAGRTPGMDSPAPVATTPATTTPDAPTVPLGRAAPLEPTLSNFLRLLHRDGWTEIRLLYDGQNKAKCSIWLSDPDTFELTSQKRQLWATNGWGAFYGVCPRRARVEDGTDADVDHGYALWADLDGKAMGGKAGAAVALGDLQARPSILIDSGRGYHAFWLLREAVPAADVRAYNRRMALRLGSDSTVANPARVLRLPGSLHVKDAANPRPVAIVGWHPERVYILADFAWLPAPPVAGRVGKPLALRSGDTGGRRYALEGLKIACERLGNAPAGEHAATLYANARWMGKLGGAGLLTSEECRAAFDGATVGWQIEDWGTYEKTFDRGWTAGLSEPALVRAA